MSLPAYTQPSRSRLHAFVEGRVQGVNFRAYVVECAHRLNLTGWVRNTWDGEVEVIAEGIRKDLESLVDLVQIGPPAAMVTGVRQEWEPYTGEFSRFQVRLSG